MSIDLSNLTPWGVVAKGVFSIIDKVVPDKAEQDRQMLAVLQLEQSGNLEQLKSETQLALGQITTDQIEAHSNSVFKSGWRPWVGWVCGMGLAYSAMFRPILGWIMENTFHWSMPPDINVQVLVTMLITLLGIGTQRTIEKLSDKDDSNK